MPTRNVQMACLGLVALLLSGTSGASARSADAYRTAREEYYAFKARPASARTREQWLKLARRFEQVAGDADGGNAAEARFTAAELYGELSRASGLAEDQRAALAAYARVYTVHRRHRLADDAALEAAALHRRRGEPALARRVAELALRENPTGDKVRELRSLLGSLPGGIAASPSSSAVNPGAPPVIAPPRAQARAAVARSPRAVEASVVTGSPLEGIESPGEDAVSSRSAKESDKGKDRDGTRDRESEKEAAREKLDSLAKSDGEGESFLSLSGLQERLRQVRVGESSGLAKPPSKKEAVARLERLTSRGDELALANQLGLKYRKVAIDAGHGGRDSGAIGKKGAKEKDVALSIAKALAARLSREGFEVVMTRTSDVFVSLEERARIANEAKADLFISVHCNSAASAELRGIETYSLNTSSSRYSARLAARENATSERSVSDLRYILADLATKANTDESSRLASRVQRNLVSSLSAKYPGIVDLGHKEALFHVLLGAKMPAILVEASFVSNPEEERLLSSKGFQSDVATGISAGVSDFLGERSRLAKAN